MVQGGNNVLFRSRYKGLMRTMKLKSTVRQQRKVIPYIPCLTAMTNMVSCWQKNDYDDKACKQQISIFLQCIRSSGDASQLKAAAAAAAEKRNWWPTEVVNEHLKRFTKKQ